MLTKGEKEEGHYLMQSDSVFRMDEGYSESPNVEDGSSFSTQRVDPRVTALLMQMDPQVREGLDHNNHSRDSLTNLRNRIHIHTNSNASNGKQVLNYQTAPKHPPHRLHSSFPCRNILANPLIPRLRHPAECLDRVEIMAGIRS